MKKIAIIIFILSIMFVGNVHAKSWYDDWTVNGIAVSEFKNADTKDILLFSTGIGTSFLIHWLSHVAYFESKGWDWEQQGLNEIIKSERTNSERAMSGRMGFLGQLAVGFIISNTKFNNTPFGKGYHTGTFLEISTYPFMNHYKGGDLSGIEMGSNSDLEYSIYTTASFLLLNTTDIKTKEYILNTTISFILLNSMDTKTKMDGQKTTHFQNTNLKNVRQEG